LSPFRTVIAFFVLAIIGFALVPKLPVDLNPREKEPVLRVSFSVQGSSPELIIQKAQNRPIWAFFRVLFSVFYFKDKTKNTMENNTQLPLFKDTATVEVKQFPRRFIGQAF
jgi:hypothetical protein